MLVGRSSAAALRLSAAFVSAQHALVRWNGQNWELKDLGSRNGTFLDGTLVQPAQVYPLSVGARLGFGHPDDAWELIDAGPPKVMAVPLDGGEPVVAEEDVFAIPSSKRPEASVYRDSDGRWKLETTNGDLTVLEHQRTFEAAGKSWRFSCPETLASTSTAEHVAADPVSLTFAVSRDEEHVELTAHWSGRRIDLGSRSHNYLLLTLARFRLNDSSAGLPESSCGWTDQELLLQSLATTAPQLNIDVFRIRQHFARAGLQDAVNVIERRPRSKQLRIGIKDLKVHSL